MSLAHLWVSVCLACCICSAQEICGIPKHGPSADALAAFEKIAAAVGIRPGTILLYASSDQSLKDQSGTLSIGCPAGGGVERWIVYDPDLVKGDALYFALAHETAHHMNSDSLSGETPGKQQELRADYFASLYLARPPLNWTSQRIEQALNALPLPADAKGGYPSIEERRAQVNAGYAEEYALLHPNELALGTNVPSTSKPVGGQPASDKSATDAGVVTTAFSTDRNGKLLVPADGGRTYAYRKKTLTVRDIEPIIRKPLPSGLSTEQQLQTLRQRPSIVLDGSSLTIGIIGDRATVSIFANELRLLNGAKIITNGNNLQISAAKVTSDEGSIISFLPSDLTPKDALAGQPGQDGKNGGAVILEALEEFDRVLTVRLPGQNGGHGGQGSRGPVGAAGAKGADGVDHLFDCASGGADGAPGGRGGQGEPGFPGGKGGNGGTLALRRQFAIGSDRMSFAAPGGRGGIGGTGGLGGPGGPGGQGGNGTVHCGGGHGGPNGPEGPKGNDGTPGRNGARGRIVPPSKS